MALQPQPDRPNQETATKGQLRVSVATLNRVLFKRPSDQQLMLALERVATFLDRRDMPSVIVTAKPFGGGLRLSKPEALRAGIGDFQFDSQRSQKEQDFRILIDPQRWPAVRRFCRRHLPGDSDVLESQPERELFEEFRDALQVDINIRQYRQRPLNLIVESQPTRTESVRSTGSPTVRIYLLYEIQVTADPLRVAILEASGSISDQELVARAGQDASQGGKGRANGVLALPYHSLGAAYRSLPVGQRGEPFHYQGHRLAGNVVALFETIETTKYKVERLD